MTALLRPPRSLTRRTADAAGCTKDNESPSALPRSPDDVLQNDRDLFEIGFATAAEVASVTGDVDALGASRGRIDDWRVIALRNHLLGRVTLHVVGLFQEGRTRMTSEVAVIADNRSIVRTRNSVYALGTPATAEPDATLLLTVAFMLRC
jgi:hypothetical protein